ncbi:hypothetical protein [Pseudomonas schmalbachii]|uniref:Uncharacterized protein n=1 Tax=Pseudomonas schmalbachii TaxID=2816993 RepID=A0ABS3TP95_9PSED|nr:hypothetical protein [Pseudomonas schmalbachii]MBO3275198.1 hypothetical protein [Pseudomonas schmalbachii]
MDLPRTFDAWEKRLVNYFLAIGPDGDASPIRSFEVTPRTLALACGAPREFESEVENAFRSMLSRDLLLMDSLRLGSQRYEKMDVPNCFSYLAFTLLIDSLLEGNTTQSGEFRHKLMKWLGIDAAVSNLRGIALMWESLASWLDRRVQAGEQFRRLILPNPGSWSHIGYTRRLSFPSNADLRLVAHFCQEHPDVLRNLHVSIAAFPRELSDDRASWGLQSAFEEFRGAYYNQRRALGDLRFWRLLERASTLTGRSTRPSVTVEMLFDADKRALFFACSDEEGEPEPFASLNDALAAAGVAQSENLATAAALGVVFFRLVGAGRWRAEPEANDSAFGLHVAVAERHKRKIGDRLGVLVEVGAWWITPQPLTLAAIKDALREAKLLFPNQERIVRPHLSSGVRSNGRWLGRPRFLPILESDTSEYVIRSPLAYSAEVSLSIEQGQLKALQPLEGAFFIHPTLLRGEEHAPWSIRLQFVSNAFAHATLECARSKLPPLRDWKVAASQRLNVSTPTILAWEPEEPACADLLEAVYASGRSGWEEAQIIALLGRAEDNTNPWHLLRSLRDAGIVEPRLRAGWKGRVWTLREPSIIEVHHGDSVLALVEGALCSRMVDDFKLAVGGFGGAAFRHLGDTPWAPPVLGAKGVSAKALAELLGWHFVVEPVGAEGNPFAFAETRHQALHYAPTDAWAWHVGRFLPGKGAKEHVRLVRLTHIGGRDHDIYRVEQNGCTRHYLSRTAAIASAYALARMPLLEWRPGDEVLVLKTREGGLPDALATEIRRRMLRNGGPCGDEYIYPANYEVAHWLAGQLPGCISGLSTETPQNASYLTGLARRSLGRLRLQWRNGSTTL